MSDCGADVAYVGTSVYVCALKCPKGSVTQRQNTLREYCYIVHQQMYIPFKFGIKDISIGLSCITA